jgi:hypothetical protein
VIARRLEEIASTPPAEVRPARRVSELADQLAALVGTGDALGECLCLGKSVRELGAAQDRKLSKCRMTVRWLEQKARREALTAPGGKDLATEVLARTEQMLRGK